jgi:hypothetical protein
MIEAHRWRSRRAWRLIACMLAAAGCSADVGDGLPREYVAGVVTLDGQPLAEGLIHFRPETKGPTEGGSMIKDGSFTIEQQAGLVPGTYNVYINASEKRADPGKSSEGVEPAGRVGRAPKELVPAKYNSKTTLSVEIKKGGSNDALKFDLLTK